MICPKCKHMFKSPVAQAGGRARSPAKAQASRANGARGGRPGRLIRIDLIRAGPEFSRALDAAAPRLARYLRLHGAAQVTRRVIAAIERLPGYRPGLIEDAQEPGHWERFSRMV